MYLIKVVDEPNSSLSMLYSSSKYSWKTEQAPKHTYITEWNIVFYIIRVSVSWYEHFDVGQQASNDGDIVKVWKWHFNETRYINKSVVGKTKFEAKCDREKCSKSIFDFKIFLKNRTLAISSSLRKTSIEYIQTTFSLTEQAYNYTEWILCKREIVNQ